MEDYEIERSPSIFATPNHGVQYSVNVSQVFGSPHTFDEVIHLLSVATPEDIINFNINSNGGDFYSLLPYEMLLDKQKHKCICIC